jgi:DNA repair exonuclease SbcCD ATPase subunit
MSCKEYKSPPYKLIKFFKESRDSWEEVAKKRRDEIRDLKARVRDLETSRDLWKGKAKTALEQIETKEEAFQNMEKALTEAQAVQASLHQECEEFKKKRR